MSNYLHIILAIHSISITLWFTGLYFVPRFLYSLSKFQSENILERKTAISILTNYATKTWVWIAWPFSIIASISGALLISIDLTILTNNWIFTKLLLVTLLYLYHLKTHLYYRQFVLLKNYTVNRFFIIWGELGFLLFSAIYLISIFKNEFTWLTGLFLSIGAVFVTFIFVKLIRRFF